MGKERIKCENTNPTQEKETAIIPVGSSEDLGSISMSLNVSFGIDIPREFKFKSSSSDDNSNISKQFKNQTVASLDELTVSVPKIKNTMVVYQHPVPVLQDYIFIYTEVFPKHLENGRIGNFLNIHFSAHIPDPEFSLLSTEEEEIMNEYQNKQYQVLATVEVKDNQVYYKPIEKDENIWSLLKNKIFIFGKKTQDNGYVIEGYANLKSLSDHLKIQDTEFDKTTVTNLDNL